MNLKLPKTEPYSIAAIAIVNGVHNSTVSRWGTRGVNGVRLRTYKIGGRKFVCRQDLEEFDRRVNGLLPFSPAESERDSVDEELDLAGI